LPTFLVGPDIAAGNLATILPDYPLSDMGIYAIYAPNKFLSAKTRLFIDFLSRRFSADPEWDAFS
jgi:DNA-binding transcriptional LysR family regulator